MKIAKSIVFLLSIVFLTSCASGYKVIKPESVNYVSSDRDGDVKLEYKYDLLKDKYAKKAIKRGVKLVAIKITNTTDKDLVFGKDISLTYENGNGVAVMDNENVYRTIKQSEASYLFYLLLTPLNLYTTSSDGSSSSTPIGLIVGPGLTIGNVIAAGSANKKFKTELLDYNINGTTVKKGDVVHGLIGIRSDSFEALRIKVKKTGTEEIQELPTGE